MIYRRPDRHFKTRIRGIWFIWEGRQLRVILQSLGTREANVFQPEWEVCSVAADQTMKGFHWDIKREVQQGNNKQHESTCSCWKTRFIFTLFHLPTGCKSTRNEEETREAEQRGLPANSRKKVSSKSSSVRWSQRGFIVHSRTCCSLFNISSRFFNSFCSIFHITHSFNKTYRWPKLLKRT